MKEFGSLAAFAEHLLVMAETQAKAEHHALDRAARVVKAEAKRRIGEYQAAAGPFAAWAELADSTKEDRARQGYSENDPGLRSGEMREGIEHTVGDGKAAIGSDDDKLVYFELGTAKQPPRSVLGGAAAEKTEEVVKILGEAAVTALVGEEVVEGRLMISGSDR